MGQCSNLYLNPRWELNDIKKVLINKVGVKNFKVKSCDNISIGMFQFLFLYKKEERLMNIFINNWTPVGSLTLLSLGKNERAEEIMEKIAEVLGGLYKPNDGFNEIEMIDGMFNDGDLLQYHLKYAIIEDNIGADDIDGLKESFEKWHKKQKGKINE